MDHLRSHRRDGHHIQEPRGLRLGRWRGGLLVRIPTLASQPLCESFGGSFGPGPDLIGASSNPVLWCVTAPWHPTPPDPFSTDIARFVSDQAMPLAYDCLADGGLGLAWFVSFVGRRPRGGKPHVLRPNAVVCSRTEELRVPRLPAPPTV